MAFGNYKNPGEAAVAHQVNFHVGAFIQPVPMAVDARFQDGVSFVVRNVHVRAADAAVCEFLIAPALLEVWKPHSDALQFWPHVPVGSAAGLQEVPDYYFSRRSLLGLVWDQPPSVLVVQAKKDDFEAGWGQCLAAMSAAQKLIGGTPRMLYGCVSNGDYWEFGKLHDRDFTRDMSGFVISDLPALFAAWNYVFIQAKEQALAPAA